MKYINISPVSSYFLNVTSRKCKITYVALIFLLDGAGVDFTDNPCDGTFLLLRSKLFTIYLKI